MIKIYGTLFALCLAFINCSGSAPMQKKYGKWSEEILVSRDWPTQKIEIGLFQDVKDDATTIEGSKDSYYYEKMARADSVYNPDEKYGWIDDIDVFDNPTKAIGCGTRLFKQSIARTYAEFACTAIEWLACPYKEDDQDKPPAFERLKRFYTKLGGIIISENPRKSSALMEYPIHLAAALSHLMPLLEKELMFNADPKHAQSDPVTTIIQYIGPTNEYPKESAAAPAHSPSNKPHCALVKLP